MKTLNLTFALLAMAAVAAAGDINAGTRVEVSSNPPDARDQSAARAAFDGDKTYLVVWQQGRDFYQTENSDIYAARVSVDGKALDEKPIVVCTAEECQLSPSVAFAGGVFLVAWSDLRNGKDFDIYAARITPDGKVLDKDGFLVAGGLRNQYGPTVAPGDSKFLVAWQDYRDEKGYALYAGRVGADGPSAGSTSSTSSGQAKVLDANGVALGTSGKTIRGGGTLLASAGNSWFLFWQTPDAGWKTALARIEEKAGAIAVAEINARLPVNHSIHSGQMGGAASDGKLVVCANTVVQGLGGGARPGNILVFDVAGCRPLRTGPDNSAEPVHIGDPGIDAPLVIAHSGGTFLMAAKGSGRAKAPYCNQIHAARLDSEGKLIEKPEAWQVLDDGAEPCSGPALAAGKDGSFLLTYSVDGGPGKQRVVARVVNTK
ncbi:MAG: hypothetical protein C0404_08930 [Verrucomicrobia bacterium]|nr:hypothetical protein [Verrucomicrobiota bacterium]